MCSVWKAWVDCCNGALESTLRATPNIPHPCLLALVYQQASNTMCCLLVVEDGHVEHGVSQVLPGLFHGTLFGVTLTMQLPTLITVNIAFMVQNCPAMSSISNRMLLGGRNGCFLAHKCLYTWHCAVVHEVPPKRHTPVRHYIN